MIKQHGLIIQLHVATNNGFELPSNTVITYILYYLHCMSDISH